MNKSFLINVIYNNGFTNQDAYYTKKYTCSCQLYQEISCHQTSDGVNFSLA